MSQLLGRLGREAAVGWSFDGLGTAPLQSSLGVQGARNSVLEKRKKKKTEAWVVKVKWLCQEVQYDSHQILINATYCQASATVGLQR